MRRRAEDTESWEALRSPLKGAERYLYVLEILGQGVKVGITTRPEARMGEHRQNAIAFGREIGRVWLSAPHVEARKNEKALRLLVGPQQTREYLPLPFELVVEQAKLLPQSREPEDHELSVQEIVHLHLFRALFR